MESSGSSTGDERNSLWNQLPSFDPSTDDVREFMQKARFLHGVFPQKDKQNLAPRLAMLCRGTAWSQVRQLDPSKLIDAANGVEYLLQALSTWEETTELKTFELFEKAMFKIVQKPDEATNSFTLRLRAAFHDLGETVTVQEMQAFILLRQSCLSNEDKKRVLSMAGGELSLTKIEAAMRTLSTKVLFGSGETKKKVYSTNFVDAHDENHAHDEDSMPQSTVHVSTEEEDALSAELVDSLASAGDEDAMMVQQFERDFEEMMQDIPDLQSALVSYQEARQRIQDRRKSRGFWPSKSRGKSFGRGSGRKGGQKGGKDELLARIARTHCKLCGALGHWKAECPRKDSAREQANVVHAEEIEAHDMPQVIFEEDLEAGICQVESCLVATENQASVGPCCIRVQSRVLAKKFWSQRLPSYMKGSKDKWGNKGNDKKLEPRKRENSEHAAMQANAIHADRNIGTFRKPTASTISEIATCNHSRVDNREMSTGMAILDTGASRSVIGSDNVPRVLQKLPSSIRQMVREVPSCVGFRFGNNQVSHSFKQLQIPLIHGRRRIWLLIEVVPKATPFLLSIKAMKSLGANIDLANNTCFLKNLQKSLPLKENTNGLFVIDISDLCCPTHEAEQAAFAVSSTTIAQPPGLEPLPETHHAEPTAGSQSSEDHLRGSVGEPSHSPVHDLHDDQGSSTRGGDARERDESNQPTSERSEKPEGKDLRTGLHHHQQAGESNTIQWTSTIEPTTVPDDGFRVVGNRRTGSRRYGYPFPRGDSKPSCTGPKHFPTDFTDDREQSSASSHQQGSPKDRWNHHTWSPIGHKPWTSIDRSHSARWQQSAIHDPSRSGCLGTKSDRMGKEAHREHISSRLRHRPRLHQVDFVSHQHPVRRDGGLWKLLPHQTPFGRSSSETHEPMNEWQAVPSNRAFLAQKKNTSDPMLNQEEVEWLNEVQKLINKGQNKCSPIDVMEVYAYPNSELTKVAQECGLRVQRFTLEDGDLSTSAGRTELLLRILLFEPKHIWLAPECAPWSPWNRFNSAHSVQGLRQVQWKQQNSRTHLKLCNLIGKLQVSAGRHVHLENPWPSGIWEQKELREFMQISVAARMDQCMLGLKHPDSHDPMQKRTRVQTTSRAMLAELDDRLCDQQHEHQPIAGNCKWKGHTIQVSKFAGIYPRKFAKAIVKGIIKSKEGPIEMPIYHVNELDDEEQKSNPEPEPKRQKVSHDIDMPEHEDEHPWKNTMNMIRQELSKSGIKTWTNPTHVIFREVQKLLPQLQIGAIKAGKGLERYIVGDSGWNDELPVRHSVALKRFSHEIVDLGAEDWTQLSKNQQHRKAIPSHVLVCVFAEKRRREQQESEPQLQAFDASTDAMPNGGEPTEEPPMSVSVPTWTPLSATVSGPRFQALSTHDQGIIRKLHNNLGHPTAEKLSRHLSENHALRALVEGAQDFLCPSCAERKPPSLTTPGNLKDAKEFNEKIHIDGFEWESKGGLKVYVLHILDDATRFHLGTRTVRDADRAIRTIKQNWFQWAGIPQYIAHDQGGEFMSEDWKVMLQENGIRPILSAAPWQRGRIERHGGIIKEMLNRVDNEHNITDVNQLDEALQQCFRAKNMMSIHEGYSPEQAVLGRASRLPASIIDDESLSSHLSSHGTDLASDRFRKRLEMRTAARSAFSRADNSEAIRRALTHQSRGDSHLWSCGQLCMYWDRRKSPNMLEKGRWNGPAQVVSQESRTIIWITHMNRLLRCAKENLRPVSLREFQQHTTNIQTSSQDQLHQMAQRLNRQLKERSGLFQYADLGDIPAEHSPEETQVEAPNEIDQPNRDNELQPEEEPKRQVSDRLQVDAEHFARAQKTPVPDSPLSSVPEDIAADELANGEGQSPETASLETDHESLEDNPNMEPVYNIDLLENTHQSDIVVDDDGVFWEEPVNLEQACASFSFDVPMQQMQKFLKKPAEHLPCLTVAAKKSRNEVVYSELNSTERELFQQAKQKELKCWLDTNTVKAIVRDRIHPSRILASRWILTWKEDPSQATGRKPKARLVVKGFQDPDIDKLNSDSPTLTRDSRMLLLQTVSSMQWTIQSFDITTAFLRGKSDERQLAMEAPPELRSLMGMGKEHVCLLQGNAYGRVDAPLLFYREFKKRLENVGFETHPLDNCLFLLRNPKDPKKLDGILGTHVDDGIGGGNENFEKALEKLQSSLPFGTREQGKFKFTGLDIEQLPDFSIKVNQGKYIHKICPIDIPKFRRVETNSPINSHELQSLRGLCGSLQYAAVHSRPDIATKVACLQKGITTATVETLLEGNRVLKEAQNFADTSVIVRPLAMRDVCFASFGDASFASAKQLSAQQGLFIMACTQKLGQNETTDFSPIVWHSKQIGRVVRSTLSAEAYAMSSSLDKLTWIRTMWGYIKDPKFLWYKPEVSLKDEPRGLMVTDCKSLFDLVTKNAVPNCQEWRTTIEVMLLKEQSKDHTVCRWVSTAIMIADCLTKPMDSTFMRTILQLGKFRIYDEDLTLKQNANRKYGVTWVNNRIFKRDQCETAESSIRL